MNLDTKQVGRRTAAKAVQRCLPWAVLVVREVHRLEEVSLLEYQGCRGIVHDQETAKKSQTDGLKNKYILNCSI